MGRRHRLMKKISRAAVGSISGTGGGLDCMYVDPPPKLGDENDNSMDKDISQNRALLKECMKTGASLEKIEKKSGISKARKKRFEKFVAARNHRLERQDLIRKLAFKASDLPDTLMSSKEIGKRSLTKRRKELKRESMNMAVDT